MLFLAAAALLLGLAAAHVCKHDAVNAQVWHNAAQPQTAQNYGGQDVPGRALSASVFSPIRIVPVYISPSGTSDLSTGVDMTPALADFVVKKLMPAAIARWQSLLNVKPVKDGLRFKPACSKANSDGTCAEFTSKVPSAEDDPDYTMPAELLESYTIHASVNSPPIKVSAGPGLPDADIAVIVSATTTKICIRSPSMLAYAYTLARDQYGRPTGARFNFCPKQLSTDTSSYAEQLSTAMHELNHNLGFESDSWPLWRMPDGVTPRTQRAYTAINSCGKEGFVAAPSSIAYVAERGMSASWPATSTLSAADSGVPWATPGNAVAHVVTPKAAAAAQAYFACPGLSGPELENHDTTSCFLQGSHLEGRMLRDEFMCSTSSAYSKVSPITLGVHEDSGWYTANYAAADAFQPGDWGYLQGCAFAQNKISASNVGSPPHFIISSAGSAVENGCTQNYLARGHALLSTYSLQLPMQYQYFADSSKGDASSVSDFAPLIRPLGACAANQVSSELFGEIFGSTSRCHTAPGYMITGSPYPNDGSTRSVCLDTTCAADKLSYAIKLSTGATATCSVSGASVTFPGFSGSVTCGNINVICGTAAVWAPPPANPVLPGGLSLLQASLQLTCATPQFPTAVWGHYGAAVAAALRVPRAAVAVASVTQAPGSGSGGRALAGVVTMLLHLDAEACAGALGGYALPLSQASVQALAAQVSTALAGSAGSTLTQLLSQLPQDVLALTGGAVTARSSSSVAVLQVAASAVVAQQSPAAAPSAAAIAASAASSALAPGLLAAAIGVPAGALALGMLAVVAVWRNWASASKELAGAGQQPQKQQLFVARAAAPAPQSQSPPQAAPRLALRQPSSANLAPPLRLPRALLALLRSKGALTASGGLRAPISLLPADLEAIGMGGYLALLQAGALHEGMELVEEGEAQGWGPGGVYGKV